MLKIYNSLTKKKEKFQPITPNHVNIYVCGVTVYDYCHIGHARTYLAFDLVVRYLRWCGYKVKYVRNITDIDDKIINRAAENAEATADLVGRFINIMHNEFAALGILKPDIEPTATGSISEIQAMIKDLIAKGYAYTVANGDVYFSINKFADYGKLSGQKLEQLRSGERIAVDTIKQDPLDFVLWKVKKEGEPSWPSPWGDGRPGWHIECSAMSKKCLGETFDIHAGGSDLTFPHHENEIAQSEAANGCSFANYWMHSGMVRVNAEKMSKSLGNFFVIADVLKQYQPEVVRYFLISGHYRSEINYSDSNLQAAKASLTRLYNCLQGLIITDKQLADDKYSEKFMAAMDDDFNTPEALAVLFDLTKEINRQKKQGNLKDAEELATTLWKLASILGLLQQDPDVFLQGESNSDLALEIEQLIAKRNQSRINKNWAEADRIRELIKAKGIELEDRGDKTHWKFSSRE